MTSGLVLVVQGISVLSMLILSGAIALIALRSGRAVGEAVAYGLGFLFLAWGAPYILRALSGSLGLPHELIFLAYPICSLLGALLVLSLALRRWPRPQ
ncbi:hypothetical protein FHY55_09200 [Oceanicola sp. D3]|uniref:hypothetical protein n=1 Tax=Oceanicola sp. D3 TaxID=2587163 RepID=UPI00112306A2|nr:hypothetical protein [Oceanicola sp. D3]QDC09411.1 hypothetical protein FHY55_09200 [Oceanicola sp. D3]